MPGCNSEERIPVSMFDSKKAVLFDLGGTLIEFEHKPWDKLERDGIMRCRKFLVDLGFDLPGDEEFADSFGRFHFNIWKEISEHNREISFDKRLSEFLGDYAIDLGEAIHKAVEVFYEVVTENLTARDGALDVLKAVRKRLFRIGLVSNSPFPAEWHRREMDRFGMLEYFDHTVFSSDFGTRKPDPSIFKESLRNLGISAAESVHIGDRPNEDVLGCIRTGITSILVRRNDRILPENIKPDYIVHNIQEVLAL